MIQAFRIEAKVYIEKMKQNPQAFQVNSILNIMRSTFPVP